MKNSEDLNYHYGEVSGISNSSWRITSRNILFRLLDIALGILLFWGIYYMCTQEPIEFKKDRKFHIQQTK